MTQTDDVHNDPDGVNVLREILALVSSTPDPTQSIAPILSHIRALTGASGALYVLVIPPQTTVTDSFDESRLPSADLLKELAGSLSDGFHTNEALPAPYAEEGNWLVIPLRLQNQNCGFLWLAFDSTVNLDDATGQLLHAAANSLLIVSRSLQDQARNEKLGRNQNEFMRIVSHDLRSPLTSMQGFASMLESEMVGELNEKQAHFVSKILSGIQQMTSLVDNIQDAGRYDPETGFYEVERNYCDLGEIAKRIVANHLVPAEKQELSLSVVAADDVPIINADNTMLERAVTNLVDNAIKYTPNGGTIEVTVKRQDNAVVVAVRDNGHGISLQDQSHLFERHTRIRRQEHKRVKGSGLGLFIVRSVAQRHGGNAWVESREGEGSTFCFSIPLEGPNLFVQEVAESEQ